MKVSTVAPPARVLCLLGDAHGCCLRRRPAAAVKTPHGVSGSSSGLLIWAVVRPGLALVVEGAGLQTAVQDADEPVGRLAQGRMVACPAGTDRVVVGPSAW
jgi:hypothetical protein